MTRQQSFTMACVALFGLAMLAAGSSAMAAERGVVLADKPVTQAPESPSELAREGMAKMLEAFDKLVQSIPQFEAPQVNENGDIILRRKRPDLMRPQSPAKTPDPAADREI